MKVILGAGISGISAGYHLKEKGIESVIYEQDSTWGGLCGNFEIDGFIFDKAIHLSFTKDPYVKEIFSQSCDFFTYNPESYNYYNDYWLKHPAQNNLYPLSAEEKTTIIIDFINNTNSNNPTNYEEWLRVQYGNYFTEHFPLIYTKKYWTFDAKDLSTNWVGNRMYKPNIEEVLLGAFSNNTPNTYYAEDMRYPIDGGYKNFLNSMVKECQFRFHKKAISIDLKKKTIMFSDQTNENFTDIISSLPLPELIKIIKDVPYDVKIASENLWATSIALISIGFNRSDIPNNLWFYIYDIDHMASRCSSPSLKSKNNVPPGFSSMQFEVYFSKYKPLKYQGSELIEHIIEKSIKMKLFKHSDIMIKDIRIIPYGNVVYYKGMEKDRKIVHQFLDQANIKYIGRFGQWGYLWSDQSLISGKKIAKIMEEE